MDAEKRLAGVKQGGNIIELGLIAALVAVAAYVAMSDTGTPPNAALTESRTSAPKSSPAG